MRKRFNWVLVASAVLMLNMGAMGMNQKITRMTERHMRHMETRATMTAMDTRAQRTSRLMDQRDMSMQNA